MKILIAEDQPPSALFLRRTVERLGHEPTVVPDGEAAWRLLQESHYGMLISDWMMPHLDGPALCRRVRAAATSRYTYIILLTARDRHQDKLEGLRAGADDFLTKPPDPDELAVRLEIAARILAVHERLAHQNDRLADLASTDELTGLKNRRRFREDLEMHAALASRQGIPLSAIMIDVDRFKDLNDTYGHCAGDLVLKAIARTFRENLREQDIAARFGGEEFVVLLPATTEDGAAEIAERLRKSIENLTGVPRRVTASFGVGTAGPRTSPITDLLERADQALYAAKRAGRNRVCIFGLEPSIEVKPVYSLGRV